MTSGATIFDGAGSVKPEDPLVSIVVTCHNRRPLLEGMLRDLARTEYSNLEVILVDNNSSDGTPEAAETILKELNLTSRVIRRTSDSVASRARNAGFKAAKGEFIAFVDDDVQFPWSDWLTNIVAFARFHADAGALGPAVLSNDGEELQFGGLKGRLHSFFKDPLSGKAYATLDKSPVSVDMLLGPVLVLGRSTLLLVGEWDSAFDPLMYEETDLLWRVRLAGKRIFWIPKSRVTHRGGVSFGSARGGLAAQRSARHSIRSILKNSSAAALPLELGFVLLVTTAYSGSKAPRILYDAFKWNIQRIQDTVRLRHLSGKTIVSPQ